MPTLDKIKQTYEQIFQAQSYSEKGIFYDVMASFCQGRTIDIGCGHSGGVLRRVKDSIGYDLSETAAAQLRQDGLVCIVGDALELGIKSNSFDTVVSLGALEHFTNKEKALREMHRVLILGGRLVLTVDAGRPLFFRLVAAARRRFRKTEEEAHPLEQLVDEPMAKGELIGLLGRCGFRVVFHGEYSVRSLNLGQRFLARILRWALPLRLRTAPYVWVLLALKDVLGQEDNYGAFFPIRGHWTVGRQP